MCGLLWQARALRIKRMWDKNVGRAGFLLPVHPREWQDKAGTGQASSSRWSLRLQGTTADLGSGVTHLCATVCLNTHCMVLGDVYHVCPDGSKIVPTLCMCVVAHLHDDADMQVCKHRMSVWRPAQLPMYTSVYFCTHSNYNASYLACARVCFMCLHALSSLFLTTARSGRFCHGFTDAKSPSQWGDNLPIFVTKAVSAGVHILEDCDMFTYVWRQLCECSFNNGRKKWKSCV